MILLASDVFTVLRPENLLDAHGWHVDGDLADIAVEVGNIQIDQAPQATTAATGRDRGPAEPDSFPRATAYLTPDTQTETGDVLRVSGKGDWRVLTLSIITDPLNGYATCKVAQCQGVPA